ncbi:lipopolysaccharide biosynthesis protein [Albimonas pacifica]|uniref:Membrane protein involved in the export of O-antigen and teichoic acid n=1 Tax=Albimonas pacifica TaxID=1114924 RepID=A0A1I3DWI8_9RHOB|nr:hypothetical protein [Albimonas pacifica]SFH91096.1 Membrane protein involved in the export of O-antigen and teichoic acid [Albimonas pacifica]
MERTADPAGARSPGAPRRGRFLRALGGAALATLAARAAQFAMALALGAQLGPAGFGQAAFALGAGTLAGQLGAGGWPALAVRRTEALAARPAELRRLMAISTRAALRGGLAAAGLLAAVAAGLALAGGAGGLAEGLALAALVAPGAALRRLGRQQLSALFRPAAGVALEDLAAPAATLAAALAAWPLGGLAGFGGAATAVAVFAAAGAASGWASLALARRVAPPGAPTGGEPAIWAAEARALLPSLAPRMLLARADMLLIAPLLGFEAAGLYAAAQRLAFLISAPPLLLAQVLQPWISRALHARDRRRLLRTLGGGAAAILGWGAPAAAVVIAWPEAPTRLFGEAFGPAGPALAPLALAELAASLAAPLMVAAISGPGMRALGRAGLALAAAQALAIAAVAPSAGAAGAAWTVCATAWALALVTALAARGALPGR